jgi:hypothetical protein
MTAQPTPAQAEAGTNAASDRGSYDDRWAAAVRQELAQACKEPGQILTEHDMAHLPEPVQRFLAASGVLGRRVPRTVRVETELTFHRAPGDRGLTGASVQVNVFMRPSRVFLIRARMFGLPVRALHRYRGDEATFQVRAAGLLTMVDQRGDVLSRGETVTVLNDTCVFAPAVLAVDPRLDWQAIDDRTAGVTFRNGRWTVSATLRFNERDELVDFWSDDRGDYDGGQFIERRWSTPLSEHREFSGLHLPGRGLTIYDRPSGQFVYGDFRIRSVEYDVAGD